MRWYKLVEVQSVISDPEFWRYLQNVCMTNVSGLLGFEFGFLVTLPTHVDWLNRERQEVFLCMVRIVNFARPSARHWARKVNLGIKVVICVFCDDEWQSVEFSVLG